MDDFDEYRGTALYDDLVRIRSYYAAIEHDFDLFTGHFSISCPTVCGHCCERFIPDLTRLEALAIAQTLVDVQGRDLDFLEGWSRSHSACPLYDSSSHRCTAYAVRPIVCRVFCSAASRTRRGLRFGGCALPEEGSRVDAIDEEGLTSSGIRIPLMDEYGEAVDELQSSCERRLMDEAVLEEAGRIMLYKSMMSQGAS